MRSSSNSHQRGVLSPPNLNEQLMNMFGKTQNRISKQSRVRCNQPKTKVVFQIFVPLNRQRFCISKITQHLMTSLRENQVTFSKMGERSSSILKQKSNLKFSIPRNSRSNFSYSTKNLTWLFQRVQKPKLKTNQHLMLFAENKKHSLKTSFILQNRIEKVLLHLGNQIPKMNKVRRSRNHLQTAKHSSSNSENEHTLCEDRSLYDIVVPWQNKIDHDPWYSLNSNQFLTANIIELKYQMWRQVNVRAGPKTKSLPEKSSSVQNYIQIHSFAFPPSTSLLL